MIHAYSQNGYNIVVDGNSASIHLFDEKAFFIVRNYAGRDKEDLYSLCCEKFPDLSKEEYDEIISEIRQLINKGKLFSKDPFAKLSVNISKRKPSLKALCLNVAHTCNLNCSYCFAAQGKYQGKRCIMDFATAKKAVDFLVANSGTHRALDIDFFGGEPLMAWDTVKKTVYYARTLEKKYNKIFRFTLTTNGILLDDEVAEFLNQEMSNVVLSLDGRKDVHDALRKTLNGEGSYEKIVPKFQNFVQKRGDKEYYIRGTYTAHNKDFCQDIKHMLDLGFNSLSLEPVIGNPDEVYALKEDDLPFLFQQYEDLTNELIKRKTAGQPFTFYHFMLDLTCGPCIYKRIGGCGSGTEYLAVTPTGELYPCHQFVGDKDYIMGTLDEGVKRSDLVEDFKKCNCYSRKSCHDCWAKLYCAGGCSANSLHACGDLLGVYDLSCRLFKKRMECAIVLKIAESMADLLQKS